MAETRSVRVGIIGSLWLLAGAVVALCGSMHYVNVGLGRSAAKSTSQIPAFGRDHGGQPGRVGNTGLHAQDSSSDTGSSSSRPFGFKEIIGTTAAFGIMAAVVGVMPSSASAGSPIDDLGAAVASFSQPAPPPQDTGFDIGGIAIASAALVGSVVAGSTAMGALGEKGFSFSSEQRLLPPRRSPNEMYKQYGRAGANMGANRPWTPNTENDSASLGTNLTNQPSQASQRIPSPIPANMSSAIQGGPSNFYAGNSQSGGSGQGAAMQGGGGGQRPWSPNQTGIQDGPRGQTYLSTNPETDVYGTRSWSPHRQEAYGTVSRAYLGKVYDLPADDRMQNVYGSPSWLPQPSTSKSPTVPREYLGKVYDLPASDTYRGDSLGNSLPDDMITIGSLYESRDEAGGWWLVKCEARNIDGSYTCSLVDEYGMFGHPIYWGKVWAVNCRDFTSVGAELDRQQLQQRQTEASSTRNNIIITADGQKLNSTG